MAFTNVPQFEKATLLPGCEVHAIVSSSSFLLHLVIVCKLLKMAAD